MTEVTDQLLKYYSDIADKFAPQVVEAAKQATVIEAYSCLAGSLISFTIVGLFAYAVCRLIRTGDEDYRPAIFILWALGCIAALPGIWAWIDPWTWVAIVHPELYIAKQSLHL